MNGQNQNQQNNNRQQDGAGEGGKPNQEKKAPSQQLFKPPGGQNNEKAPKRPEQIPKNTSSPGQKNVSTPQKTDKNAWQSPVMEEEPKRSILPYIIVGLLIIAALFFYYRRSFAPSDRIDDFQTIVSVSSPEPFSEIKMGTKIVIKGEAKQDGNFVIYKLKDEDSSLLAFGTTTFGTTGMASDTVPFSASVSYKNPKGNSGVLEILAVSLNGEVKSDVISIPVNFAKTPSSPKTTQFLHLKAYFGNSKLDPEGKNCTSPFPLERRLSYTDAPARAAINELLKGPNVLEQAAGYFSSIPSGVKLQKIEIRGGVAYADFNDALQNEVGGSTKVCLIRAEISETLKQFPTIKNVVISINGQTEDILQP